jgi:hypothetical protein
LDMALCYGGYVLEANIENKQTYKGIHESVNK